MERKTSLDRRTRLERCYKFVVECWATDTREIADALYGGAVSRASRDLKVLEASGLVEPTDVNGAAQGNGRSGAYKSLTWQSHYDIENSDDDVLALAAADFREAFPPAKTRKTTNNKKEATMATQTTKSGVRKRGAAKQDAKPKAKASNGGRKRAEISDDLVKQIIELREGGASWDSVKAETGIGAIEGRKAIARLKGASVTLKAKSGQALAKELAAHRANGVAWYELALAAGKSEAEVKQLAEEGGASADGRVYHKAEPKPKAKPKAKAKAEPGKAKVRGSGAAGRKIAASRKARAKAETDPSSQA